MTESVCFNMLNVFKATGAVLKILLNTEHLNEIEHLATIFDVQAAFIARLVFVHIQSNTNLNTFYFAIIAISLNRYKQKVDIVDTDKKPINQFLADQEGYMEYKIQQYIKVWNRVSIYNQHIVQYMLTTTKCLAIKTDFFTCKLQHTILT